jgi:DNA (cytosine-5)-methyltransferase 1
LDIGFHDAGFEIVESVEIERQFCQTLEANARDSRYFNATKVNCIDIREYKPNLGDIDFVIGGPPCQTFSSAGRRANGVIGIDDERGMLFREYIRLLQTLDPMGFLFENVYGIVGAQGGEAWRSILEGFAEIGYRLFYRILDAADYGVPQHRERLIIVGLKDGEFAFPRPLLGPDSPADAKFYTAQEALLTAPNDDADLPGTIKGRYGYLLPDIPPGLNYSFYTSKLGHPNPVFAWRSKFSDFMYKADPTEPVRTIKAQGGQYTGPYHWDCRHFSIAEYKRLQTFPDDYHISGSRQDVIRQIGNSVPPQLARILALAIREQVFGKAMPFELGVLADDEQLGFRRRKQALTKRYQDKAREALSLSKGSKGTHRLTSNVYRADLSSGFALGVVDDETAKYRIQQTVGKDLSITVGEQPLASDEGLLVFNLAITPKDSWALPVRAIVGEAAGHSHAILTVLWKSIEQALTSSGMKADLVQLRGYYQYPSEIVCALLVNASTDVCLGRVLEYVTQGIGTRTIHPSSTFADLWDIGVGDVDGIMRSLRALGYEARNHNTNPRIENGDWLVPYEFPTLNPLSIQLRKTI